jgi:hypothetical protein
MSDKWQKIQLELAFAETSRSEALRDSGEGTETLMAKREAESMANSEQLMEEVCGRKNCQQALARVKSNKGSAGIDGMTVERLPAYLKQHWPTIREQLLSGTYKPSIVWVANGSGHQSTYQFGYYTSRLYLMAAYPVVELIFCNHRFSAISSNKRMVSSSNDYLQMIRSRNDWSCVKWLRSLCKSPF